MEFAGGNLLVTEVPHTAFRPYADLLGGMLMVPVLIPTCGDYESGVRGKAPSEEGQCLRG